MSKIEDYYHPVIPALYEEYKQEHRLYRGDFEDWIASKTYLMGLSTTEKSLFGKLRLRLRKFRGNTNNDSHVFILNDDSKESLEELRDTLTIVLRDGSQLSSKDIVTVTGKSIIGMTREDMVKHGPEFFVISPSTDPRTGKEFFFQLVRADIIGIRAKYFVNIKDVLKMYLKALKFRIVGDLAKAIANVENEKGLFKLFRNLHLDTGVSIGKHMKTIGFRIYKDPNKKKQEKNPRVLRGTEMLEALK